MVGFKLSARSNDGWTFSRYLMSEGDTYLKHLPGLIDPVKGGGLSKLTEETVGAIDRQLDQLGEQLMRNAVRGMTDKCMVTVKLIDSRAQFSANFGGGGSGGLQGATALLYGIQKHKLGKRIVGVLANCLRSFQAHCLTCDRNEHTLMVTIDQ